LTDSGAICAAQDHLFSFAGSPVRRLPLAERHAAGAARTDCWSSSDCHSSSPFSSLGRLAARARRQFIGRAPTLPWSDLYVQSSRRKLEILPILRQGRPAQDCQSATCGWAGDLVCPVHILRNPGTARVGCRRSRIWLADTTACESMRDHATASCAGRASIRLSYFCEEGAEAMSEDKDKMSN
jgi:hypothetical protein